MGGGGWKGGGDESFLRQKAPLFLSLVFVTFLLYRLRGNEANPSVREIANDGANFVYFGYSVGLCIVSL